MYPNANYNDPDGNPYGYGWTKPSTTAKQVSSSTGAYGGQHDHLPRISESTPSWNPNFMNNIVNAFTSLPKDISTQHSGNNSNSTTAHTGSSSTGNRATAAQLQEYDQAIAQLEATKGRLEIRLKTIQSISLSSQLGRQSAIV